MSGGWSRIFSGWSMRLVGGIKLGPKYNSAVLLNAQCPNVVMVKGGRVYRMVSILQLIPRFGICIVL